MREHVRVEFVASEEIVSKSGQSFFRVQVIADRSFFGKECLAYPSHRKEYVTIFEKSIFETLKNKKGFALVEMISRKSTDGRFTNKTISGILG
jgi:hypothetical protein